MAPISCKTFFIPKCRVEIVVKDSQVKALTEAIIEVCRSENVGDGKIFVSSIENATRIRTGESGDAAIS